MHLKCNFKNFFVILNNIFFQDCAYKLKKGVVICMFFCIKIKKLTGYIILGIIALFIIINIIKFSVSAIEESKGVHVPIIMYHSVLKDETLSGDYVITPVTLEKDLIYLKENGYTTIFISDLINYVYNDGILPEKPVVLTFDDGMVNNSLYVLPLLKKYEMKAVFSIVGKYTQTFSESDDKNPTYAYLTWSDIADLKRTGCVEIGNHSYNMHSNDTKRKGSTINPNESYNDYRNVFISDVMKLQTELETHCKLSPEFYTFPYGFDCDEATQILRDLGFKATLSCREKPNFITKDTTCLIGLNRYNRPSGISTESFMKKALK